MVFNKADLHIESNYKIKLSYSSLLRMEDALRNKQELLITIDASHYGFKNGNGTIYRHDTVKDNIVSFIHPSSKPIIERHRPKTSEKFGKIIAADYKKTHFYDELSEIYSLEDLSTEEYVDLCKDVLIPKQKQNSSFNGLGYVQLIGKLTHQDSIEKVINQEFLAVSIGADPLKLICSECYQDQTKKICDHYAHKKNNIFMLAESLAYEELSFVPKGADPFGKVTQLHDELYEESSDTNIGIMLYDEFKENTSKRTFICSGDVCKILEPEEEKEMAKPAKKETTTSLSYIKEFTSEKVSPIVAKLKDELETVEASIDLKDEDLEKLCDCDFAIVQKTAEGLKRRFPIQDKENLTVATQLIDSAEDLTDQEKERAFINIEKAAKKFGVEFTKTTIQDEQTNETETQTENKEVPTLESLTDALVECVKAVDETKLQDNDGPKPISFIFSQLESVGRGLKWAGEDLMNAITYYLKELGKETVELGSKDALQDELNEAKEEIQLLDEQNRNLNYSIRVSLVDEIISLKTKIGSLQDADHEEETGKLMSFSYDSLKEIASELRKITTNKESVVNNKKNFKKLEDPTLQDSQEDDVEDQSGDPKLTDEDKTLSQAELKKALRSLFH